MTLVLYDMRNADGEPVSPYSWRIREALHLLELPFEARLLTMVQVRDRFASSHKTVPVLVDGATEVGGSWAIANYLAEHHDPDQKLFGGPGGRSFAAFFTNWVDATVLRNVTRMIVKDVHDRHAPEDHDYFRASQEKRLGDTLENLYAARKTLRPEFQVSLHPARMALKTQRFMDGSSPTYADFALHSTFQWSRAMSDLELLRPDDRLNAWLYRLDEWLSSDELRRA